MWAVLWANWALFLGLLLLMIGNGLQGSLLGVRASLESFGTDVTGVVMAAFFAGFLIGSVFTSRLVTRVGHVRVFAALASVVSSAILIQAIYVDPIAWFVMRLVIGFCFAGLYIVVESWLNDASTNTTRGQILSAYMFLSYGGVVGGQLLLNAADPATTHLFILVSVVVSVAIVPILVTVAPAPAHGQHQKIGLAALYRASPLGIVGITLVGVLNGMFFGFGSVFGSAAGLSVRDISFLLAGTFVAGAITQVPVGRLSDMTDRRFVITGCAVLAILAAVVTAMVRPLGEAWLIAGFAVCGAFALPLYSLCIAHTNDYLQPREMVAAASQLMLLGGVGAILGPVVSARAMAMVGPDGYLYTMAIVCGALVAFALWRMTRRAAPPEEERTRYTPFPARASTVAGQLSQRVVRDAMDTRLGRLIRRR